jgi:hypothetical protein
MKIAPKTRVSYQIPGEVCPYCGATKSQSHIKVHMERCAFNPPIYEATRAALDDGTGKIKPCGLFRRDYGGKASGNVLAQSTLIATFVTWRDVADAFGLEFEPTKYDGSARKPAKIDARANEIGAQIELLVKEIEAAEAQINDDMKYLRGKVNRIEGGRVEFDAAAQEYTVYGGSVTWLLV